MTQPHSESGPQPTLVGQGAIPADLDRVNWGAFAFAGAWIFRWGPRSFRNVFIGLLLLHITVDNIALLFFDSKVVCPAVAQITLGVSQIVLPALMALYGARVNRALWARESAFLEDEWTPGKRIPIERYRRSVRFWTWLLIGVWMLEVGFIIHGLFTQQLGWGGILPWSVVVAAAALLVYDRTLLRRQRELTSAST